MPARPLPGPGPGSLPSSRGPPFTERSRLSCPPGEGDVAGQGKKPTVVRVTVLKPEWTSGVGLRWTET